MKKLLRGAFASTYTVGLTGLFSPLVMGMAMLDERAPDGLLHFWGAHLLRASGVRTAARGLDRLPPGHFVLACNHQSNLDPLLLFAHIRRHLRFVAKAQLRRVPILGPALASAGNVFVDRRGGPRDRELLRNSVAAVRERVSICFFAEGTRSDDGVLLPFKKGAATMALEAQVPLVPAAIAGTHRILPKGSVLMRPAPATLVIGTPIETTGLNVEQREFLTEQARAQVVGLLAEAEALALSLEQAP